MWHFEITRLVVSFSANMLCLFWNAKLPKQSYSKLVNDMLWHKKDSKVSHDDVIKWKKNSAILALGAGNSPVTGEFPTQRTVTRSFDVSFDLLLNKRLSTQSWGRWFETPSCSLWRTVMYHIITINVYGLPTPTKVSEVHVTCVIDGYLAHHIRRYYRNWYQVWGQFYTTRVLVRIFVFWTGMYPLPNSA